MPGNQLLLGAIAWPFVNYCTTIASLPLTPFTRTPIPLQWKIFSCDFGGALRFQIALSFYCDSNSGWQSITSFSTSIAWREALLRLGQSLAAPLASQCCQCLVVVERGRRRYRGRGGNASLGGRKQQTRRTGDSVREREREIDPESDSKRERDTYKISTMVGGTSCVQFMVNNKELVSPLSTYGLAH